MFSTTNIDRQILKSCIASEQSLHPRIFCRRWFGLEDIKENGRPRYTEDQILLLESEHGYREKCINQIAQVLKIKPNTVQRWGKGVEFDKIPPDKRQQYETYLGYADLMRILAMGMARQNKNLLLDLLPNSKSVFSTSDKPSYEVCSTEDTSATQLRANGMAKSTTATQTLRESQKKFGQQRSDFSSFNRYPV